MKKTETTQATQTKKGTIDWIDENMGISGIKNHSDNCCFFNLYIKTPIGNVAIYGCKVITTNDGKNFIGFPTDSYEVNGERKFKERCNIRFENGVMVKIIDYIASKI